MADAWWMALVFIFSVWVLYPVLLWMFSGDDNQQSESIKFAPKISVIIAAHNEALNLSARIQNIFSSEYPSSQMEVVVASDGSTDKTADIVNGLIQQYPSLKFIDISPQGGRSNAHNVAVRQCVGEVLVFTDAETVFEPNFMEKIVDFFQRDSVGFASGVLKYQNQGSSAVTESAAFYWKFEYFLRERESQLGLYAFGSGACCAIRRELYRDISPEGDVDFTTPLDVVLQGKKCVHVANAIAYDVMPDTPEREFRARVRMTAKNLYGTIQRWGIVGVLSHPVYTLVIFFHKIGRWLTPFGMLIMLFANVGLLADSYFFVATFVAQVILYALAFAGYKGANFSLAQASYSFCLANVGFFLGVLRAVTGRVPRFYKPVSQTRR